MKRARSYVMTALGVAIAASLAGCNPPPPPEFSFVVSVDSDPGKPLPNVSILRQSKELGKTGPDGKLKVAIHGAEGTVVELKVACPDRYKALAETVNARLNRLADSKVPQLDMRCVPLSRELLIAIRADNGGGLPVFHLDSQVGTLDASGAAHLLFTDLRPGEPFELRIDASSNPRISPSQGTFAHTIQNEDELVAYSEKFTLAEAPHAAVVYRGPTRVGPIKVPVKQ